MRDFVFWCVALSFPLMALIAIVPALLPEDHILRRQSKPYRMDENSGGLRYSVFCTVVPGIGMAALGLLSAHGAWVQNAIVPLVVAIMFGAAAVYFCCAYWPERVKWDNKGIEGPGGGFGAPVVRIPWSGIVLAGHRRFAAELHEGKKHFSADFAEGAHGSYVWWMYCAGGGYLSEELRRRRPDLFAA